LEGGGILIKVVKHADFCYISMAQLLAAHRLSALIFSLHLVQTHTACWTEIMSFIFKPYPESTYTWSHGCMLLGKRTNRNSRPCLSPITSDFPNRAAYTDRKQLCCTCLPFT